MDEFTSMLPFTPIANVNVYHQAFDEIANFDICAVEI